MEKRITKEMNDDLQREYSKDEVVVAMQQIGPLKSPGPDGFGASLYQNYWEVVGDEVTEATLSFLRGKGSSNCLNHTHVVLIPKIKEPKDVGDFRPISLCNVFYKIIAKTLANRFKKVLNTVISLNQSSFIPGRLITDNIIAAYEILHSMKKKKKKRGNKRSMALKLDISKAYDRVEWGFLRAVMVKLGFGEKWVGLIMQCVQTVSYAILVNGKPGNSFTPSRGLRQIYEEASSHCLNRQKTALFSSSNIKADIRERIRVDVGAGIQNNCEKYLGLPVMVGKSQYNTFRGIKDRVWNKISNWKNHFLSPSSKEVLLKAVAQAVPTHHMNVFKLPVKLCKEISALIAKFWWGSQQNENRIQWKSWAKMGTAKTEGGMGFRELQNFNTALLAKQCWRIMTMPQFVAARVLKDKYFKHSDLLKAKLGWEPSKIWRSLWGSIGLLKEGLVWRVGNCEQVKIWEDKWIPKPIQFSIQSPQRNWSIQYTYRENNRVAHTLAKLGLDVLDEFVWMEGVHQELIPLFCKTNYVKF
ncbi:uncharacterized protein LOC118349641 [Juglans regia]|uniref:Uncharacterized protein LOC118349641 n=1 Tax=Juglans regia TaxID=51240 RepID=A0A6P9EQJ9_JUGRE|nr:uncharacterized protein LOC118349641 [Juglans regia]